MFAPWVCYWNKLIEMLAIVTTISVKIRLWHSRLGACVRKKSRVFHVCFLFIHITTYESVPYTWDLWNDVIAVDVPPAAAATTIGVKRHYTCPHFSSRMCFWSFFTIFLVTDVYIILCTSSCYVRCTYSRRALMYLDGIIWWTSGSLIII